MAPTLQAKPLGKSGGQMKPIGFVFIVILLGFAIVAELIQFILSPLLAPGTVVTVIFFAPLALWLFLSGRMNRRNGIATVVTAIIGLIPVINALPECIAEVVSLVIINNFLPTAIKKGAALTKKINKIPGGKKAIDTALASVAPEVATVKKAIQEADRVTGGKVSQKFSELASDETAPENTPVQNISGTYINGSYTEEQTGLLNLKDSQKKKSLDLRDAATNKDRASENTLDLQNRMQKTADTGINLPQPRRKNDTINTNENESGKIEIA